MISVRYVAAVLVLLLGLAGCARDSSAVPAHTSSTEGETPGAKELMWQEAKARTQAMELEIVNSIPEGKVVKVDLKATGTLLNCGGPLVNWNGGTIVTLSAGTELEPLVRALEAKYQDSRFTIKTRDPSPAGSYEVQLRSPDTAEIYIIGAGWDPDTILITSSSECFTWPEGEYKGGKF
ncbi:hypothetical protein KKR91_14375 [Arthrobacter jiangjiafuii]|uniref:Lipoprotein n=1 Tax=Arthrobacter jiangjiafuii TaxID=2817475 RepID=A0A975M4B1_9MICC|nr:hypothetical protein [Arthrobacter jiangjiafuii]MBP3042630.1 hypothetical protein [Arthrobacter jiangjiafuii]QWC09645.1 hypothetical protein KKR91_14375 [Arthrobacter jiangjiafuii]